MSTILSLNVPSMTCGHCAGTIKKALGAIGLAEVEVNLQSKEVRVGAQVNDLPKILATLAAEGYEASAK